MAEVARTVPGVRDVRASLQIDYPEVRVETDREKAGPRRRDRCATRRRPRSKRRSATSTRRASGSTRDNGQSYYVVTSYDGERVADTAGARRSSRCAIANDGQAGAARRVRQRSAGASARSPSSATSSSARRTCSCRPRGATSARAAADLERALKSDPADARHPLRLRRSGRAHARRPSRGSASRSASR